MSSDGEATGPSDEVGSGTGADRQQLEFQHETQIASMELERLKIQLQIEQQRTRQLEMQESIDDRTPNRRPESREETLGRFSKMLRSLLTPIPSDPEVPVWLEGIEGVFRSYGVPESIKSHLVLPLIAGRIRHIFSKLSTDELNSYNKVKETILSELRLSPGDYLRQFRFATPMQDDTWQHFASRLESYYAFYTAARNVTTFKELFALQVADQIKQTLSQEVWKYVKREEGNGWATPHKVAKFVEAYEDIEGKGSARRQVTTSKTAGEYEHAASTTNDTRVVAPSVPSVNKGAALQKTQLTCFVCNGPHYARNCPERVATQAKTVHRVVIDRNSETVPGRQQAVSLESSELGPACGGTSTKNKRERDIPAVKYVNLRCGDVSIRALIDTGAEITVLRENAVPESAKHEIGNVTQVAAFGAKVVAKLARVGLNLDVGGSGHIAREVPVMCALTGELATDDADCLFSAEAWHMIKQACTGIEGGRLFEAGLDLISDIWGEERSLGDPATSADIDQAAKVGLG
ncbi:hypothetical protein HPB49_021961 [Dermacentor silvarum]|uniref:Uncharacterized protein n=1 Tax=Dermacentor silvarum TaxID=543639 RepID=A0ACB8D087_DERSI|nr:hypothetical protein HPB49_021961 [Dermacentor silvarum]